MLGMIMADLVELDLDRANVAQLPETDQLLDMFDGWTRARLRLPARGRDLVGFILPFELEQLPDGFEKSRNIDRLHQVAVMKRLRQRSAVCFQRARGHHEDASLMMA